MYFRVKEFEVGIDSCDETANSVLAPFKLPYLICTQGNFNVLLSDFGIFDVSDIVTSKLKERK